ncbi:hypothetical protein NMG60_11027245 [Bertholletia excelsa]
MSERSLRRNISASNRIFRPSKPSPRRQTLKESRRSARPSRPIEILPRCASEPSLWLANDVVIADGEEQGNMTAPDGEFYRPQTSADIFSSPDHFSPQYHQQIQEYNKEAKVVINVTVEGCPGPVRTMAKLGSSVEDIIKLVVDKYEEEGRSPHLAQDASSTFELHHSYFSLQSLKKSDVIGEVGTRSFYLRKGVENGGGNGGEIVSDRANAPAPPPAPLFIFSPAFLARKMSKIIRRTRKLWKILGCIH